MNEQQLNCFENVANEIQSKMREEGYLSADIVAVAYFMLKNNIEDMEKLIQLDNKFFNLLNKAENLLNE